jgi:tyrosyl-tRNA synthetase
LDAQTLSAAVAELPHAVVSEQPTADSGPLIVDLLAEAGLVAGRGAGRRAVSDGGVSVNNVRIVDPDSKLTKDLLLHGRWAVLRRGKRTLAVAEFSLDSQEAEDPSLPHDGRGE